jgi:hypothetical protein
MPLAKACTKSCVSGYLKSTVSFPVTHTSDGLHPPIRVVNHAHGSNLIVTALKSRGFNTTISSINGNLKVPGKILFEAVPVTRMELYPQERVKFIKLFKLHHGFVFSLSWSRSTII